MKPRTRIIDLGSGSGEMLCTWAHDYEITGLGIDISRLFGEQAKRRVNELGVADKVDIAACIGGVVGTIELLAKSLRPGGIALVGEPYWQ